MLVKTMGKPIKKQW